MTDDVLPKPEPKEIDEKRALELSHMMQDNVLKGQPYGDERCDNCLYYMNPDENISYCWHPKLRILVGGRWWRQWGEKAEEPASVRAEDKQLGSADLEKGGARARGLSGGGELRGIGGGEVVAVEATQDRDLDRQRVVLGTIRAIFDKRNVTISMLGLPDHETRALEALRAAVSGRGGLGTFVY